MAARSRLSVTVFLSIFLLIVAVRGNAGPAGKSRSRPRSQLKPTRVAAAELPDDLFFHLSSTEIEPSTAPEADSDFNEIDWSPGKRGRDHGKKLSFSDFYVSRGKKLNPDMFYVSRGKRDVADGLSDRSSRPQVHESSSASRKMDRQKSSGLVTGGGSDLTKNRLMERIKRGIQQSRVRAIAV